MSDIKINGLSISTMGATLLQGGYSKLLAPPPVKSYISNNDVTKNGVQVLTQKGDGSKATLFGDRDIILTFLIKGENKADFFAKYKAFFDFVSDGLITLHVPELESNYRLIYRNCTTFDHYRLNACKMAIKFHEPDPTNRG
jgi:hypothetical protein